MVLVRSPLSLLVQVYLQSLAAGIRTHWENELAGTLELEQFHEDALSRRAGPALTVTCLN